MFNSVSRKNKGSKIKLVSSYKRVLIVLVQFRRYSIVLDFTVEYFSPTNLLTQQRKVSVDRIDFLEIKNL